METPNIFEVIDIETGEPGHTVHSNTHCNALVENPFAWDDEDQA